MSKRPLRYRLLHWRGKQIENRLVELEAAGAIDEVPNLWQIFLGVLYMYHRAVFRPETIGVDERGVERETARSRRLRNRLFRAPVVLRERVVNPLDHSGLASSTQHVIRHLIGAYHPGDNFHYDIALFAHDEDALWQLERELRAIVEGTHPRAEFFKDLVIYEGYHERLLAGVEQWLHHRTELDHILNPDTTLKAYLTWCARQPSSARATLRAALAGKLSFAPQVPDEPVLQNAA